MELIQEEASKADIIYHFANCDHEPSAHAIAKGLAQRESDKPGFWIHTSGTMILATETIRSKAFGDRLEKVFDDWKNVDELTSQPDDAAHRVVDKIVLAAASGKVKTAIVCPPAIYGPGRGPDNKRSVQIYEATRLFLQRKKAFQVGKGQNIWHQVHVQDLSDLYLLLGEAAANGGSPATWNDQGYYLAENGPFVWGEMLESVAKIAHKKNLLPTDSLETISFDEADSMRSRMGLLVGTNSRGVSERGKRLLGWKPKERLLKEELADIVELEARTLGMGAK